MATHRVQRRRAGRLSRCVIVVVSVCLTIQIWRTNSRFDAQIPEDIASGTYELVSVQEDGSLLLRTRRDALPETFRVMLLSVRLEDSPRAVTALKDWLAPSVRLRFDRRRLNPDGILEAYVYSEATFLNAEVIRQGLASEQTHPADAGPMVRELKQAEREARSRAIGIWAPPRT